MSNMNDSQQQQPPYDPMAAQRPLPQSKYIQDLQQNMPQEMRSPHFGDFQKQTVMDNQTEFDKQLDDILLRHGAEQGELHHSLKEAIKAAVDTHVIGKPRYDLGPKGVIEQQRLALWGNK